MSFVDLSKPECRITTYKNRSCPGPGALWLFQRHKSVDYKFNNLNQLTKDTAGNYGYGIYTLPGLLPEANASAVIDILSPDDESLKTDTNLSLELVVK